MHAASVVALPRASGSVSAVDSVSLEADLQQTRAQLDRIRQQVESMRRAPKAHGGAARNRIGIPSIPPCVLDGSNSALSLGFLTEFAESLGARLDDERSARLDREDWADSGESAFHTTDCWLPAFVGDTERQDEYNARRLHEIDVPPGAPLRISHGYGDVIVEPGDGARVEVLARVTLQWQGKDAEAVSRYLEALTVSAVRRGDSVLISVNRPPARPLAISQLGLDLTVQVPAGHSVVVGSSYGDVVLRGLSSPLTARASFGDVEVVRTAGPLVLASQNGDVVVRRHVGPLTVENANGAVNLIDVTGDVHVTGHLSDVFGRMLAGSCALDLRGGSGLIADLDGSLTMSGERAALEARDISGRVALTSDLGDVRLARLQAGAALHVRRGSIELEECAGDVQLEARDAYARIQDPSGQLFLNTVRGDVVVDARESAGLRRLAADAIDGSIIAYVSADLAATVHAEAKGGQVLTDLPLTLAATGTGARASGIVGKGTTPITLQATAGSVYLYAGTRTAHVRLPRRPQLHRVTSAPQAVPALQPER